MVRLVGVGDEPAGVARGDVDAAVPVCEAAAVLLSELATVPPEHAVRLRAKAEISAAMTCDFPMPRSLTTRSDTFHVTQKALNPDLSAVSRARAVVTHSGVRRRSTSRGERLSGRMCHVGDRGRGARTDSWPD